MEELFLKILNMSITATYVLVAVLILRLLLKRGPKWISYSLWSLVLFRLVCPVSFSSALSIFGRIGKTTSVKSSLEYIPEDIGRMAIPQLEIVPGSINTVINNALPAPAPAASVNPMQILIFIGACIWMTGIAAMLLYSAISYLRLKYRLQDATLRWGNVFETDKITSPFLCGLIKPQIYLPMDLNGNEENYVLYHEQTHIARKDHLIKPLAFLVLSLHWFNPFMWLAFILMSRDLEMSCDERVISKLDSEGKAGYSTALMRLAMKRPRLSWSPLAFGESNVKRRIKNVLNFKKPAGWVVAVSVILAILLGIACAANPADAKEPASIPQGEKEPDTILEPASPKLSPVQTIGIDMPQIDYADDNRVIFHGYFGLFVYDVQAQIIIRSLDLEPIGCHQTQGSDACEVAVSLDGSKVFMRTMETNKMYIWDLTAEPEVSLSKASYESDWPEADQRFTTVDIRTAVENANGNYSYRAADFGNGSYGYLHNTDWTLGTLTYTRAGGRTYRLFDFDTPVEEWVLISRADVDQDKREDSIYLDKAQINEQLVSLRIFDPLGAELWSQELSTSHAGWSQLFLCELDGRQYLLRYNPAMYQGYCSYVYTLFTLENGNEKTFSTNTLEFDINGTQELEAVRMIAFADEVNALLGKSTLLISSDGGTFYFGPASAEPFFERFSWLDDYPQLYENGDTLETKLNKYSEYAASNRNLSEDD